MPATLEDGHLEGKQPLRTSQKAASMKGASKSKQTTIPNLNTVVSRQPFSIFALRVHASEAQTARRQLLAFLETGCFERKQPLGCEKGCLVEGCLETRKGCSLSANKTATTASNHNASFEEGCLNLCCFEEGGAQPKLFSRHCPKHFLKRSADNQKGTAPLTQMCTYYSCPRSPHSIILRKAQLIWVGRDGRMRGGPCLCPAGFACAPDWGPAGTVALEMTPACAPFVPRLCPGLRQAIWPGRDSRARWPPLVPRLRPAYAPRLCPAWAPD